LKFFHQLAKQSFNVGGRRRSELFESLFCRIVRRHSERESAGGTPALRKFAAGAILTRIA
jgi:hypothetical protein